VIVGSFMAAITGVWFSALKLPQLWQINLIAALLVPHPAVLLTFRLTVALSHTRLPPILSNRPLPPVSFSLLDLSFFFYTVL